MVLRSVKRVLLIGFLATAVCCAVILTAALGMFDPPGAPFAGEFESVSIDPDMWQVDDDGRCSFERVESPVRSGSYALRIQSQKKGRCEV